jgi:tyrosinase
VNTRKSVTNLTSAERQAFVRGVLALKTEAPSRIGLGNRYDDYVRVHADSMMSVPGWAHRGPAFGPWHRAFLRNFELDLQEIDASISLPYWDWSSNQATASLWTDDFLGGDGDAAKRNQVVSGPFAYDTGKWRLAVREEGDDDLFLARALGRGDTPSLPTPANVAGALGETPYDAAPWARGAAPSFRDRLEGWHGAGSLHNRVHLWVGGSMLPSTSPNDPVFFLHHCNVDRLWAEWTRRHPTEPYVPVATATGAPVGHRLTDPMQPWGSPVTVQSTLNNAAMGYRYDTDPSPSPPAPSVGAPLAAAIEWQYRPNPAARPMRMGVMFELSPQDVAAGGHDPGQ